MAIPMYHLYHPQNLPGHRQRLSLEVYEPSLKMYAPSLVSRMARNIPAFTGAHRLACRVSGRCLAKSSEEDGQLPTRQVHWFLPDVWDLAAEAWSARSAHAC